MTSSVSFRPSYKDTFRRGIVIPLGWEAVSIWMNRLSWDPASGVRVAAVDFEVGFAGSGGGGDEDGVFDEVGPRKNLSLVTYVCRYFNR